jgi:hypothetical protein
MTDPLATEPTVAEPSAPGRRRLALIGGGLALVAGIGGWVLTAAHARGQIETVMGVPTCTGTEVRWVNRDGQASPQMTLNGEMECSVDITVRNTGRIPVTIDELSWPILGPEGGPGVEALYLNGGQYLPRTGGIDADFPVDVGLEGESYTVFQLRLAFRPDGCTPEGVLWIQDTPALSVSGLGLSGETAGGQILTFRGTTASSCDANFQK